jgi:OOP family OmpA-OmpF porin
LFRYLKIAYFSDAINKSIKTPLMAFHPISVQTGVMKKIFLLALLISCLQPTMAQKEDKGDRRKGNDATASLGPYIHPAYKVDSDGDGVPDANDKCPSSPKGEKVTPFGCPFDKDNDGLYDSQDRCPDEAGPMANGGCPWGDRDSDGIRDNKDECPDAAGPISTRGCPDTDGDGLLDNEDDCPKDPGPALRRGCPEKPLDSDGDGVEDTDDKCPNKKGTKANQGCPDLSAADKAKIDKAFKNLLFETNKAIIKKTSYPSLNGLADVMLNNPGMSLLLEGHTDDVGNDDANMRLSEQRAQAVKTYLVGRGIPDGYIDAKGYGETQPKVPNTNAANRAKNRRVEMKPVYR